MRKGVDALSARRRSWGEGRGRAGQRRGKGGREREVLRSSVRAVRRDVSKAMAGDGRRVGYGRARCAAARLENSSPKSEITRALAAQPESIAE